MLQTRYSPGPVVAYVAPFAAFVVPTLFESNGWLGLGYETVYSLKTLLVAATLWAFRRRFPPFSTSGFALAIVAGALGSAVWIGLTNLQAAIPGVQQLIDSVMHGSRAAYDPFLADGSVTGRVAFVIVRLVGLTIVVPIMEEIFWRGFLARYLIDDDFQNVPQGAFTAVSFLVVTAAFAAAHPEILAALAWGAMVGALYRKTANLWACVVMHAVTNGLLGGYILTTRSWNLW